MEVRAEYAAARPSRRQRNVEAQRRRTGLHAKDVAALRNRIADAEATLIDAPADAATATLRGQACDLAADLLMALGRLERALRGDVPVLARPPGSDDPYHVDSPDVGPQESLPVWLARQTAPSGVVHRAKPNPRRTDGVIRPMAAL